MLVIVTSLCCKVEWVLVIERLKGTRPQETGLFPGYGDHCMYVNCVVNRWSQGQMVQRRSPEQISLISAYREQVNVNLLSFQNTKIQRYFVDRLAVNADTP